MPIYEYCCSDCGERKDFLQKVSDAPIKTCPACGSESYAKALTAAGFQLKGSGWYATDFKSNSSAKAPTTSTNSTSSEASKTDTPSAAGGTSCNPGCACH